MFSSPTRTSIILTWTALTGADTGGTVGTPIGISSYDVYRDNGLGGDFTMITSTTGTTYTMTSMTAGLNYKFKLQVSNVISKKSQFSTTQTMMCGTAPIAPGIPTAVTQSSSEISFYWDEPFDNGGTPITSYELEIIRVSTSATTTASVINANSYTFNSAGGLVAGETYTFRVRGLNFITDYFSLGGGTYSPKATLYSSDLPAAVTTLASSAVTQTSATVSWTLHTLDADKGYSTTNPVYILEQDDCNAGAFSNTLQSSDTLNSYAVASITPGSTCRYRLRVQNNVGYSAYSDILSITYAEIPGTQDAPTYVSRSGGDTTTGATAYVQIAWTAPTSTGGLPILGYSVEVQEGTGGYNTLYDGSTNPDLLTYKFEGLNAGSQYFFRVLAHNSVGSSTASAATEIYAATLPPAMPVLTVDTITPAGSASTVQVSWTLPTETGGSAITGYYLQQDSGYNTSFSDPGTLILVGTTTNTYTALIEGAYYRFRIAPVNIIYTANMQTGDALNVSPETYTLVALVPDQMASLAQSTSGYVAGSVYLTWTAPADNGSPILNYDLLKDNGSGVYYTLYSGTNLYYNDTGLVSGSTHNYKIKAVNLAGDGLESATAVVGTAGAVPGKITDVVKTTQSQASLVITWTAPTDTGGLTITKYWVTSDSADFVYTAAVDNGAVLTYTKAIAGADAGKTFRFKVAAQNSLGIGEYSDEIQLVAADAPDAPVPAIDATANTVSSIKLTFTPGASNGGSDISGYLLYRDQGIAGTPDTLIYNGTSRPEVIEYTAENLTTGYSYTFKLYAMNEIWTSATAGSVTGYVGTVPSQPGKPQMMTADFALGTLTFNWTAPATDGGASISQYNLWIDNGAGVFTAAITHSTVATLQY